jgi:mRNA-degrading endonuclease toxin of MazEF toxin-antitoxin module
VTPIIAGGVYLVRDERLTLLPEEERIVHLERRRYVVVSADTNSELGWPLVLGCPVSASTSHRTRFDVKLAAGEAGTNKRCWIRVPALQPLLKVDLEDLTGKLDEPRLVELYARVVEYLGLTSAPPVEPWADEEPF